MKKGPFNLQLVYRETAEVFEEHAKEEGGEIYAEVEPDAEYFVRVSSEASDTVYVDIQVDGRSIEKGRRVTCLKKENIGIWKRDGDYLEENPLKFNRADVKIKNGTDNQSFTFWTGVVTALFYGDPKHMITESAHRQSSESQSSKSQTKKSSSDLPIYHPRESLVYTNNNDDVSGNVGYCRGDDPKLKKGVKTVRGETTLFRCQRRKTSSQSRKKKRKKPNETSSLEAPFLGSIKLNYCSTIGLIHAEILPKPPDWMYAQRRVEHPPLEDNWKELSEAKVKKIHIEGIKRDGATVQESRVVELFDLTDE